MPKPVLPSGLSTYLKHQLGPTGADSLLSGDISDQLYKNILNNLPSKYQTGDKDSTVTNYLDYYTKLWNKPLSGNFTGAESTGISKAATQVGEDPNTWLKIADIETARGFNDKDPSVRNAARSLRTGKYEGYFQISNKYVDHPNELYDPYLSTLYAIAHNKGQFNDKGKLDISSAIPQEPAFNQQNSPSYNFQATDSAAPQFKGGGSVNTNTMNPKHVLYDYLTKMNSLQKMDGGGNPFLVPGNNKYNTPGQAPTDYQVPSSGDFSDPSDYPDDQLGPAPGSPWAIKNNSSNILSTLKSTGAVAGGILSQSNSSLGNSALGGFLSGIGGGPIGMGLGLISGVAQYGSQQQTTEEQLRAYQTNRMKSHTTLPFAGLYGGGGSVRLKAKHKKAFAAYAKSKGLTMDQAAKHLMKHMAGGGDPQDTSVDPMADANPDINDVTDLVAFQSEVGEWMVTPEGELVPTMATELHKDMDSKDVTDKTADGAYVFSIQSELDTSDLSDEEDILFTSPGYYSEKTGNIKGEDFRFTDYVGRDKSSFAEKVKRLQKKIPLISEEAKDILTEMTNSKNQQTRTPILLKLMAEQEKTGKTSGSKTGPVAAFGGGGFVKKMAGGGDPEKPLIIDKRNMTVTIGGKKYIIDRKEKGTVFLIDGNGVARDLTRDEMKKLKKDAVKEGFATQEQVDKNFNERLYDIAKPSDAVTNAFGVDKVTGKTANQAIPSTVAAPSKGAKTPITTSPTPTNGERTDHGLKVNVDGIDYIVDRNGGIFTQDKNGNLFDAKANGRLKKKIYNNASPDIKEEVGNFIDSQQMNEKGSKITDQPFNPLKTDFSAKDQNPPIDQNIHNLDYRVPATPVQPGQTTTTPTEPNVLDEIYKKLGIESDAMSSDNQTNYENQLAQNKKLLAGKDVRNGLGLANNFLSNALQSTRNEPGLRENTFLANKYAGTPSSIVDQQSAMLGQGQAGIANELIRGGGDSQDIISMLSGMQQNTVDAQSNLRGHFADQNRSLKQGYFGELNANQNANNLALANSTNIETDNLNKKLNFYKNDVNQYLTNTDKNADTNYNLNNNALGEFNKNRMGVFQNDLNINALRTMNTMAAQKALQDQLEGNAALKDRFGAPPVPGQASANPGYGVPAPPPSGLNPNLEAIFQGLGQPVPPNNPNVLNDTLDPNEELLKRLQIGKYAPKPYYVPPQNQQPY